jgi:DNA-binding CsgD family transcriptional regulator
MTSPSCFPSSSSTSSQASQNGHFALFQAVIAPRGLRPRLCLSERENQVLVLVSQGYKDDDMARLLRLSPHTVKSHVMKLLRKFDVRNRLHLVVRAVRGGYVDGEEGAVTAVLSCLAQTDAPPPDDTSQSDAPGLVGPTSHRNPA